MRRKLIFGNWKMHGSKAQTKQLLGDIANGTAGLGDKLDIGICPTHLHIGVAEQVLRSSTIKLGAQNICAESAGAFTGEVAAQMLAEYGVSHVLVGHSERRDLFSESDALVAEKFNAAQANGLLPILCLGESLEQRQQGITEQVLLRQLDAVIGAAGIDALAQAVIAYEPIWAIGTGQTASAQQAQQVHLALREYLAGLDASVANGIRIIYGGSVKSSNAKELFDQPDIDGGLVGGASLQAEEFISICKSAD